MRGGGPGGWAIVRKGGSDLEEVGTHDMVSNANISVSLFSSVLIFDEIMYRGSAERWTTNGYGWSSSTPTSFRAPNLEQQPESRGRNGEVLDEVLSNFVYQISKLTTRLFFHPLKVNGKFRSSSTRTTFLNTIHFFHSCD